MVEKTTHWKLSTVEKNGITDRIDAIMRAGDAREARLYEDLWSYFEEILNEVATQARRAKGQTEKEHP